VIGTNAAHDWSEDAGDVYGDHQTVRPLVDRLDRIGRIEEVPGVNCQEPKREEVFETLKVTLREAQEALAEAGSDYQELQFAV
jgi:hypothetical protein